jgi:uncharacterized protein (TIGR02646 family)
MIRVDRTSVPTPTVLSTGRAKSERRRAEEFFAALRDRLQKASENARSKTAAKRIVKSKAAGGKTSGRSAMAKNAAAAQPVAGTRSKFNFNIYREDEIKAHLNQLFHGKCAYCEMRYAATQPMDVEHFRPKAEAADFDGSTCVGYYWLAADWTNLLPSCIDCNRARIHREEPSGREMRLGKETLFPIEPGTRRATFGESLENERPLLLDPCRDNPELYLAFPEGVVVAAPAGLPPAVVAKRVDASVRVYGLNRTDLVQERRRVLLSLRRHFDQIRQLTLALSSALRDEAGKRRSAKSITSRQAPIVTMLEDLLSFEVEAVLSTTEAEAPFALMARQEVAAFEAELGRGLPVPHAQV